MSLSSGQIRAWAESDVVLAHAAGRGIGEARRRLVDRLYDRVRTTVLYLAGSDRDADDLVHLSLLEILRSAHTFRGEGRLESWAVQITVRTSLRNLKKRHRREAVVLLKEAERPAEPAPGWGFTTPDESIEQVAARQQIRQRLALLLQKLSAERRAVAVLRWVQGYSIAEIAEMTGAPVNTVRGRLREGKKQLRRLIRTDPVLREWDPEGDA